MIVPRWRSSEIMKRNLDSLFILAIFISNGAQTGMSKLSRSASFRSFKRVLFIVLPLAVVGLIASDRARHARPTASNQWRAIWSMRSIHQP